MPSPFGTKRYASTYYQYGGQPMHFAANWSGMPMPGHRAAETAALAGIGPDSNYIEGLTLGDYDTGQYFQTGERSVYHGGIEQSQIDDEVHRALGVFGALSQNEKRLAMVAGAAVAGFVLWRMLR